MKYSILILTLLFTLPTWSQTHNAGIRTSKLQIEQDHGVLFVRDFCSFGMQFVGVVQSKATTDNGSGGVSVIQVIGADGKPMICGAKPATVN